MAANRVRKALNLALAVVALGEAAWLLYLRRWLGFPDGHFTELDEAMGPLYLAGALLCGLLALWGWVAAFRDKPLRFVVTAFVVANGLIWFVCVLLISRLKHGGGG